jgi:hypothetical protein
MSPTLPLRPALWTRWVPTVTPSRPLPTTGISTSAQDGRDQPAQPVRARLRRLVHLRHAGEGSRERRLLHRRADCTRRYVGRPGARGRVVRGGRCATPLDRGVRTVAGRRRRTRRMGRRGQRQERRNHRDELRSGRYRQAMDTAPPASTSGTPVLSPTCRDELHPHPMNPGVATSPSLHGRQPSFPPSVDYG